MCRLRVSAVALTALIGAVLGGVACSSDDAGDQPAVTEASGTLSYCADSIELMNLLDGGGTVAQYNALLAKVIEGSPVDHATAWTLMLTLSEEPFSYDNFNPAVDALERTDLNGTCRGLERLVVDDDGRVRQL